MKLLRGEGGVSAVGEIEVQTRRIQFSHRAAPLRVVRADGRRIHFQKLAASRRRQGCGLVTLSGSILRGGHSRR